MENEKLKADTVKLAGQMQLCFKFLRLALFIMAVFQAYILFGYISSAESCPSIEEWAVMVNALGQPNGAASLGIIENLFTVAMMAYAISPITALFADMAKTGEPFVKRYAFKIQKCAFFLALSSVVPSAIVFFLTPSFAPQASAAFSPNIALLIAAAILFSIGRLFFSAGAFSEEVTLESMLNGNSKAVREVQEAFLAVAKNHEIADSDEKPEE